MIDRETEDGHLVYSISKLTEQVRWPVRQMEIHVYVCSSLLYISIIACAFSVRILVCAPCSVTQAYIDVRKFKEAVCAVPT